MMASKRTMHDTFNAGTYALRITVSILLLLISLGHVSAEIKTDKGVYSDISDHTEGIRLLPASDSTWRTFPMETRRFQVSDRIWLADDYFSQEYGVPCDFSQLKDLALITGAVDVPHVISHGTLTFHTTDKPASLMLGAQPQREAIPPLRTVGFSGPYLYHHLFLEIAFDNGTQQETQWQLSQFNMRHFSYQVDKPFTVRGTGKQIWRKDLGYLRNLLGKVTIGGLKLTCLTQHAEAKISHIKLAPMGAYLSWRHEFRLPFTAERCPFYFEAPAAHRLFVNGTLVSTDVPISKDVWKTVDLARHLKKGTNVILLEYPIMVSWAIGNVPATLIAEGAAISSSGEIFRILGSRDWRYRLGKMRSGDLTAGADTSQWETPKLMTRQKIGMVQSRHGLNKGFKGFNPGHMGLLDIKPATQKHPVFDEHQQITYRLSLPSAMKGLTLALEATDAESNTTALNVNFSQLDNVLHLPSLKPGAYWLTWSLLKEGKPIEKRKTELIVAGPIRQDLIPFKDFADVLQRRLEPVYAIDCTKEIKEGPEFIDVRHYPLTKGETAIVTRKGLTYRETGRTRLDSFNYRLHNLIPGEPYLVEVEIPDDHDRYIYCQIIESYLGAFQNNHATGANGFPASSGTSATGGRYPLSGRMKAIRFIHVPGTTRGTIVIANGASTGAQCPAAASKITIYRFKGGIPGLKLPQTDRGWGPHTERYLHSRWAAAYNLAEANMMAGYTDHVGAWINTWKAHKNYIAVLRYMGQNQVMQGTYMYRFGAPGGKFCEQTRNDGFDLQLLLAKMYAHNGIREYLSIEYMHPLHLYVDGKVQEVSDRQIWLKKARGIYNVDKNGNQAGPGIGGDGLNPFSNVFQTAYKDFMSELYRKYDGLGIKGLFVTVGHWWSPAIMQSSFYHISSNDISYDDDTIEQFEQDTGIALHADEPGRNRFMKRHRLLTGQYKQEWNDWRVRKLRSFWKDIQQIVSSGKDSWEIILNPQVSHVGTSSSGGPCPFSVHYATKQDRDTNYLSRLRDIGYEADLYGTGTIGLGVVFRSKVYDAISEPLPYRGTNLNQGKLKVMQQQNIAIFTAGLNEFGIGNLPANKPWWWRFNTFCGNVKRPAGSFAFAKELDITRHHIPRVMVDNWMDNQPWFADDVESRRLAQGFFSTPLRNYAPSPSIQGITAMVAGDCLRLVNLSVHDLSGHLTYPGNFREKIWDRNYRGTQRFTLRPYEQLVFRVTGDAMQFKGEFAFDSAISDSLLQTAQNLLLVKVLKEKIATSSWDRLGKALQSKDAYRVYLQLNDYEIAFHAQNFFKNKGTVSNQLKLEAMMREQGIVRINCGGKEVIDARGNVWLPDQEHFGFGSYGNEFAKIAHRDQRNPVKHTDYPEVFFTEVFGTSVFYTIPLPNGDYVLELLSAETYPPNTLSGRSFEATVNGSKKVFDLYKHCPGFLHEAKLAWQIRVTDDKPIFIQLKGAVGLNGIVIRRAPSK